MFERMSRVTYDCVMWHIWAPCWPWQLYIRKRALHCTHSFERGIQMWTNDASCDIIREAVLALTALCRRVTASTHLCYGIYVWMHESNRVISECIMSQVLYARPRHRLHSPDCDVWFCDVWFCDVLFNMIYIMRIWMSLRLVIMNEAFIVHV